MQGVLMRAFCDTILPLLVQLGGILAIIGLCKAGYQIFRQNNYEKFVSNIKSIIIAYAVIKGSYAILFFINKVVDEMVSKL